MTAGNRFLERLIHNFDERPDRLFCRLVDDEGERLLTWSQLGALCARYVSAIRAVGCAPGETVLIFLRHGPDLYGSYFGTMLAGCVPSFMPCTSPKQDPRIYWASHRELLAQIRPAAIVAEDETFAEMAAAGLDLAGAQRIAIESLGEDAGAFVIRPEDSTALLQHSSGTTGLKKGVALSFRAILAQLESYAATLEITDADAIVSWLPLYHDMGLIACCVLPAHFALPVTHIDAFAWLSRPDSMLEWIGRSGATLAWLPNFAFEHLANVAGRRAAEFELASVRAFVNCSEPCKPATFDRFAAAFAPAGVGPEKLQCCYAMAETVFAVTQTPLGRPPRRLRFAAASLERGRAPHVAAAGEPAVDLLEVGPPIAGIDVATLDERGVALASGLVGEIGLSGDFLFSGYNRNPERTAKAIRGGVYFTGDVGFVHEGRLYILGRIDDMIIVNGRNLYAHEVESVVGTVRGLKPGRSVAVAQTVDSVGSAALVLICETARGSERGAREVVREVMTTVNSTFGVAPRRVKLVDEGWLVKTTSGKISRGANLAKLAAEEANGV